MVKSGFKRGEKGEKKEEPAHKSETPWVARNLTLNVGSVYENTSPRLFGLDKIFPICGALELIARKDTYFSL